MRLLKHTAAHVEAARDAAHVRRLFVVSHLPLLPMVCAELLGSSLRVDVAPSSVVHLSLVGADRAAGSAVLSGFYAGEALAALGR